MKFKADRFYRSRIFVLVAIVVFYATTVFSAVPQVINYQGTLSDNGSSPVNATLNITFTFYDAQTLGTALWQEVQSVDVVNGVFSVQLGADIPGNPLDPAFFEDPLFLGIAVDGDAEMAPRQELAAVGYAFRAKSVENDTLNSLTCGNGEVPKWNGSDWACSTDADSGGDITGVTAGTGLTGGGASGNVNIAADTAYLQRRVLSLCAPGQSIRVINANGSVICEVDTDTDTTYSAGPGLALNGTTFSIPTNGISTSQIDNGAVVQNKIADNSVTGAKVLNGSLTGADIAATNSIVSGHLAPNSVGNSEISPGAVGTSELLNGSVTSVDLNDNAKGIGVNGSVLVHSSRFQAVTQNSQYLLLSSGYLRPWSTNLLLCVMAPVELPHGVTVTHFEVSFFDNSLTQDFMLNLDRSNFSTGATEPLASVSTSGSSNQVRVGTDATIQNGVVNGFLYSYHIYGCITADGVSALNTRLYAARIRYN